MNKQVELSLTLTCADAQQAMRIVEFIYANRSELRPHVARVNEPAARQINADLYAVGFEWKLTPAVKS